LGVGVAYPLDTIKTKAQVLSMAQSTLERDLAAASLEAKIEKAMALNILAAANNTEGFLVDFEKQEEALEQLSQPLVDFGSAKVQNDGSLAAPVKEIHVPGTHATMMEVSSYIYQTSGIGGFFAGVQTSMMGQGIIKAVVFFVNAAVLQYSQEHHLWGDETALQLLGAAAMAGFVTSFLAAPVDRIKVLMQCSDHDCYHGDENECVVAVLQQEGWKGFLTRGLGTTMLREIPAYSLYFGVYGGLQAYCGELTAALGPTLAPALYGAAAGMACWLPIYPIDVIRTVELNTEGYGDDTENSNNKSPWELAVNLYETSGWEAFYDGLGARLLRQAVNHAVTFSVYEMLIRAAQQQPGVFG